MRDEETGSWWQQVSGEAIQGSLKGVELQNVVMEELSYGVWKRENPAGRVLRPDEKILAKQEYETEDWEKQVGKMRVTTSAQIDKSLDPRALIVGISVDDKTKAYPFSAIEKQSAILDLLGGKSIVVLLGDDKHSVRSFERTVDGKVLEFFVKPDSFEMVDAETGSTWDFTGRAVRGDLMSTQLIKIPVQKDYWFDWKTYHPDTQLYTLGSR
ncbi:hypothetical protein BH10ACI2_BH10ACI2_24670 [soil metagenome]